MLKFSISNCQAVASGRGGYCLSLVYKSTKTKLCWSCDKKHVWWASFEKVKFGSWCPFCAGNVAKTMEDCIKSARLRGGKFLSKKYLDSRTKYLWECELGHRWRATSRNVLKGSWCHICSSFLKKTIQDCRSLAEKQTGRFLSVVYVDSQTKYLWGCKRGHVWKAKYNDVQQGKWCRRCSKEKFVETFLKKYGVTHQMYLPHVKEKIRKTNLARYGCEHPSQNKEVALKIVRSANNTFFLVHWKTGESVLCQAGWEKLAVEYLNENKINFKWQPQVFKTPILTPTGRVSTYRPDCYLSDKDLWVEIKGYFRGNSKEKWNWFHKEYPNSELWDKKKLKEMKIL